MADWKLFLLAAFLVCSVAVADEADEIAAEVEGVIHSIEDKLDDCPTPRRSQQENNITGDGAKAKLPADTKCVGSGIAPEMDTRDLKECRCPKGQVCSAWVPEVQVMSGDDKHPEKPHFQYTCSPKEEEEGEEKEKWSMGLYMPDLKKGERIETVQETVTRTREEIINEADLIAEET